MAGSGRGSAAARSPRHHVHAHAAARRRGAQCPRCRLWRLRGARGTHSAGARLPRRVRLRRGQAPAHAGRRLDAYLRAPQARRPHRHPDERTAAPRWPAGARRQALQRDRPSRRGRRPLCRHRLGVARALDLGAGDHRCRSRSRPHHHGGSRRRADRRRRASGRRSRRATLPPSMSLPHCTARNFPTCCRWRRISIIRCRATTWRPS